MHVPLWKWDLNYAEASECAAPCGMLTFTSCRQQQQEEIWWQLGKRVLERDQGFCADGKWHV